MWPPIFHYVRSLRLKFYEFVVPGSQAYLLGVLHAALPVDGGKAVLEQVELVDESGLGHIVSDLAVLERLDGVAQVYAGLV